MKTLVIHPKDKTTDFLKPIYYGRGFTVITGGMTKADVAKEIDAHDHIIMMGHGTPQGLLSMNQFNGKPKPRPKPAMKPSTAIRSSGKPVTKDDIKSFYSTGSQFNREPGCDDEDDWFTDRQVGGGSSYYSTPAYQPLTSGYVIDDSNADQLRGKKLTAIWCNADQYMEWNKLDGFYTGMFISDTSEAAMIGTADFAQWQVDESNYAFAEIMRKLVLYPAEQTYAHAKRMYGELAKRNAIAKYNYRRLYVSGEGDGPIRTQGKASEDSGRANGSTRRKDNSTAEREELAAR